MKVSLGFFWFSIGKSGVHMEFEKHPFLWFVFHVTNKEGFDEIEKQLYEGEA